MPDLFAHLPIPSGGLLYGLLAVVVIASSLPVIAAVVPAEPLLVGTVLLTAGDSRSSIWLILCVTIICAIAGDIVSYGLGRHFGRRLAQSKALKRQRATIRKSAIAVRRNGLTAIMVQRWLIPGRGFVPAILGMNHYSFHKFVCFASMAAASWAAVVVVGTHYGGFQLLNAATLLVTAIMVINIARRILKRRRASRQSVTTRPEYCRRLIHENTTPHAVAPSEHR